MKLTTEFYKRTESFIAEMPKEQRKEYGQFFTVPSTADFMASLASIDFNKQKLSILDTGYALTDNGREKLQTIS